MDAPNDHSNTSQLYLSSSSSSVSENEVKSLRLNNRQNSTAIEILDQNEYYMVIAKPPSILCHYSAWTGLLCPTTTSRATARTTTRKSKRRSIKTTASNDTNNDGNNNSDTSSNSTGIVPHQVTNPSNQMQEKDNNKDDTNTDDIDKVEEIPILQRVRQQIGRRVNLVHRLDRGASGCLLMTYSAAATTATDNYQNNSDSSSSNNKDSSDDETITLSNQFVVANNETIPIRPITHQNQNHHHHHDYDRPVGLPVMQSYTSATAILSAAMADKNQCIKTYIAIVRGEGILHGEDLKQKGWFIVDRPIKNENGIIKNATTRFYFIAGQHNGGGTIPNIPRASIVLAQPNSGRWHQIRKHLNGLSHPIIGDTTHGNSYTNRLWKEQYDLPKERLCLHLLNLVIRPIPEICPNGINVTCPLPSDMMYLLSQHLPLVLSTAKPILEREGFVL